MNLYKFLKQGIEAGAVDYRLRARIRADGRIHFYIHPACVNGATADFYVDKDGNLKPICHDI